jgi:hypothetical protein
MIISIVEKYTTFMFLPLLRSNHLINLKYNIKMNNNVKIFHEMLFIYNAVLNGWSVSKIDENKYKFKKNKNSKIYNLDRFNLKEFINKNTSMELFI